MLARELPRRRGVGDQQPGAHPPDGRRHPRRGARGGMPAVAAARRARPCRAASGRVAGPGAARLLCRSAGSARTPCGSRPPTSARRAGRASPIWSTACRPAIERLNEEHRGRDIVAVTHGGTIRAALALALGIPLQAALRLHWWRTARSPASTICSPTAGPACGASVAVNHRPWSKPGNAVAASAPIADRQGLSEPPSTVIPATSRRATSGMRQCRAHYPARRARAPGSSCRCDVVAGSPSPGGRHEVDPDVGHRSATSRGADLR